MKSQYDIVVVGGGPAGSMAAKYAASAGVSVCLLEKTRDIGYPVRCGEAIGENGLKQFVEPKDSWIAETITACTLVAPNDTKVDIQFTHELGYILNRRIFDYDLSRLAADEGAEIYTKAYVNGLLFTDDSVSGVKLNYLGENREIKAKLVIAADGVDTRVGRWAGLKTNIRMKDMESCVQYSVGNVEIKRNYLTMYVGNNHAPGGYLWIFPKGDRFANIGIGISGKYSKDKSAKRYLDEFMEKEFPNAAILTTMCGGVPCASPLKKSVTDGLIVVGDAAHQVNPVTGGGITPAMKGGMFGGQVGAEAVTNNDLSEKYLNKYAEMVHKDFGKRHKKLYKIKNAISQLSDQDLNSIADKVASIQPGKRSLGKVFTAAMMKKPSLLIDAMRIFSGI